MPSESQPQSRRIVVIGNPATRRVAAWVDASRRIMGTEPSVLPYSRLLIDGNDAHAPPPGSLVKIESPTEDAAVLRAILKLGVEPMEALRRVPVSADEIDQLPLGRGEILHPLQWFLGFARWLTELEAAWGPRGVRWMSAPEAIVTAFDKIACLERWNAAGLSIPGRNADISTYAALRRSVAERHARKFIKLRYGYSAMGAVALEWRGSLVRAITTVDVTWFQGRPRLYVTKRPRTLQREFEIAWLIDTLGQEEIVVEDWLPKARWKGRSFDLRLVTIGGRVHHVVGRASASPFTNLNLDAKRIAQEDVVQSLGAAWPRLLALTESAAACLSGAAVLGMDVLVRPCRKRFALLEANAFGDYLPGLTYEGLSTCEAQIRALTTDRRISA